MVTVMIWPALMVPDLTVPKLSDVAETVHDGAAMPVPVNATDCVAELALSVMTSVAERAPEAVGAKLARMVQLAETASELGQLFI